MRTWHVPLNQSPDQGLGAMHRSFNDHRERHMNGRTLRRTLAAMAIPLALAAAPSAQARVFNDLFLFGDSYTDTGAYVPLTNGTTAAAYLGQLYGITMTTSKDANPGTKGVNFAESGARVAVGPNAPATQPRSLTQQVAEFQAYVQAGKVTFDPGSSLFFLLGGLNDHNAPAAGIGAATLLQVQGLYGLGARYFEIALLPSLIPAFTDSANNLNPEYQALLPQLQALYPAATFKLSNWGGYYDDILTHPANYGVTNTTDQCFNLATFHQDCTTPDPYFYYYVAHPSDHTHRIVGQELFAEALAIPEPMSAELIAVGLVGLSALRRRSRAPVRGLAGT
jgi:phospholipase/lecithinase/hemolysin